MTVSCSRMGKWISGCRFEPRYDLGAPAQQKTKIFGTAEDMARAIEVTKPKTYVRDVCVTCGRTIERQSALSPD